MKSITVRWSGQQYDECRGMNAYFNKICPTFFAYEILSFRGAADPTVTYEEVRIKVYYYG